MSVQADLTLLIVRLVQGAPRPPVNEWMLFPRFIDATHAAAVDALDRAETPVLVAPLLEAGCVGVWTLPALDPNARAAVTREMDNRATYFEAKFSEMWPAGVDTVRLSEGDADLRLSVDEFRAWYRDFYVFVGHGLERDVDPRVARLTIRVPGGGRRPIGLPAALT